MKYKSLLDLVHWNYVTFRPNDIDLSRDGGEGGGGGDSHIKVTEMPVVSLRDVNCKFRSHLGCLGRKVTIFVHSGIA